MKFRYMRKDGTPIADVAFTWIPPKVDVINYTDNVLIKPFGVNDNPTIEDLEFFLESRCFPGTRANCKEILEQMGLDHYDIIEIIKHDGGNCNEDDFFITFL